MSDLPVDILVSKSNVLSEFYVPKNLVVIDNNENNFHQFLDEELKPMLRKEVIPFLNEMIDDAKKDGLNFIVDSGYRSYSYQQRLLDKLVSEKGNDAYRSLAKPGESEHQTGLAFDIAYFDDGIFNDTVNDSDKVVKWLIKNSYKYGFILRYPKRKEHITGFVYEPWHYRFVGVNLAKKLYKNKLTLDEYYALKK